MKKVTFVVLALCIFATGLQAKEILFDSERNVRNGVKLKADDVLSPSASSLDFEANVKSAIANQVKTPEGTFTLLSIPGYQHSEKIGAPSLPVMNELVEVPFGAELSVEVLESSVQTHKLSKFDIKTKLYPRQPPQPKDGTEVPFTMEKGVYETPGYYQYPVASVKKIGALRHVNLALLTISPISYDPVKDKIEVYNNVKVRLHIKDGDLKKTMDIKKSYASKSFSWLYKKIVSPHSLELLNERSENRPIHYVIVSDGAFKDALAPFIEWKTQKGFDVTAAYTDEIGGSPEEIQTYIHGLYNNPPEGKAAPDFVLFVGDHDNLPAFQGETSHHITDLYYVAVTEGDNLPDILTGRFSAKTVEDLLPQIQKTVEYEKYEFGDPSFLERVTMIAGWDWSHAVEWGWPQIKYGLENYFNEDSGIPQQDVYLSQGSHQNESNIYDSIDAGCSFINYTAHGSSVSWADPRFTKTDIASLQNTGMYPLIVGNCCLTNKFEGDNCYGGAWLRADERGAIGYIGGSNSTYWDEDLWWGCGFYPIEHPNELGTPPVKEDTGQGAYDGVFEGPHFTNAGMILAGNLAVESSNSSRKLYYWEVYHIMGDPSMMVYWGIPDKIDVNHAQRIAPESKSFVIDAPVGSYVGLSVDGVLCGAGHVGESGKANIELKNLPESGSLDLVVTGKNLQPYMGSVTIAQ